LSYLTDLSDPLKNPNKKMFITTNTIVVITTDYCWILKTSLKNALEIIGLVERNFYVRCPILGAKSTVKAAKALENKLNSKL